MDKLILPNPRGDFFKVDNDERKKTKSDDSAQKQEVVALQGIPPLPARMDTLSRLTLSNHLVKSPRI